MFMFYTLPGQNCWTACGTGELHAADELPLQVFGFLRLQWQDIVLFVPEAAAVEMSATDNTKYDVCVSMRAADKYIKIGRRESAAAPAVFMVSFGQLLRHLHAFIEVRKYLIASATDGFLYLRSPRSILRRSSWGSCFSTVVPSRIAEVGRMQQAVSVAKYQPTLLRRAMSGNNVMRNGSTFKNEEFVHR
jgi:hypothetical protein